jgi:hypothetical protein
MTAGWPDSFNHSLVESGPTARLGLTNRTVLSVRPAGRGVQTLDRKATLWETDQRVLFNPFHLANGCAALPQRMNLEYGPLPLGVDIGPHGPAHPLGEAGPLIMPFCPQATGSLHRDPEKSPSQSCQDEKTAYFLKVDQR